jgi:uncharacterized membrane protein
MKPLIVLISTFLLAVLILKLLHKQIDYQLAGRIAMAAMLVFTAIGHFVYSEGMTAMIPDFVPLKLPIVYATGILEILMAFGLVFSNYQFVVGWILIIFFLLILPANIKAAMENINYQTGEHSGEGLSHLWFRIPLQIIFIVWVCLSAIKK